MDGSTTVVTGFADEQAGPGSAGSADGARMEVLISRCPREDRVAAEPAPQVPQARRGPSSGTAAAAVVSAPTAVETPQSDKIPARALAYPAAPHDRSPPSSPQPPQNVDRCTGSAPSPDSSPPYLAAGVLPFCVLGGDLLFLLGQQLRFRSRVRGNSFPVACGASRSTAVVGVGDAKSPLLGRGTIEEAPTKSPGTAAAVPHVRRPRRGPRLKLSMSSAPPAAGVFSSLISKPRAPSPVVDLPYGDKSTSTKDPRGERASGKLRRTCERRPPRADCGTTDSGKVGNSNGGIGTETVREKPGAQDNVEDIASGTGGLDTGSAGFHSTGDDSSTAAARANAGDDGSVVGRSPQRSEEQLDAPGQGTVPAGLLWSDFGGGREPGEDAEETASREFAEESFGIFCGVRLDGNSVARSQATMSSTLRDKSLRGKRVFECRNGGYVMFIAEVDFVPDLMMNLARKEIIDAGSLDESGADAGEGPCENNLGQVAGPGFSEKTDFAWVPASVLLAAMNESRNRSTRKVVVKLGGCRYLRLFHKFVISLWGLDLAAVIKAALAPLHARRPSMPLPRVLLLKSDPSRREPSAGPHGGQSKCAIRGIDCVRPSFLSGRKRTSLGIIAGRRDRKTPWRLQGDSGDRTGGGDSAGCTGGRDASGSTSEGVGEGGRGRRVRSKMSGAACRKRRRQCKNARRSKATAAAAVAAALTSTAILPAQAVGMSPLQNNEEIGAESV